MAMTLSHPHPQHPYELPGVMLGDAQLAQSEQWAQAGLLALVGMGVEPGLSDVFARYASDELFMSIEEIGVRDGADLVVEGYDFAPTFSIWTTIEECLNPPLIWERERGFYTTRPFSEPETFDFPEGIGRVQCVNVEHEEVVLIPRWVQCERVTFKYGLGEEFIEVLKTLQKLGLDKTEPVSVRAAPGTAGADAGADAAARVGAVTAGGSGLARVAPRDVVAATLPDPAKLGERMTGRTCAGTWVRGLGKDGAPRSTYLYHVVDNEQTMREYGSQAVVWQTAINPVVALELLDEGKWSGKGVLGPEAFPPGPFLERLAELGAPHGMVEVA
jgi:saccharopine dehydrogenase-like NADP-dependent oxidoreductase